MSNDDLGRVKSKYRTSRMQAIVLLVGACIFGVLAALAAQDKNLAPIAFVLGGAAIYFLGWGAQLAMHAVEVREHGVRLRYLTRRVDIPFSDIAAVGVRRRTVNGLPGSCDGIWMKRQDGATIMFRLESNAEQASGEIAANISLQ